jgi:outer membrane protein assembly factor BamB
MMNYRFLLSIIISLLFSSLVSLQVLIDRQWPSYRGYMASGVLDNANLPENFDIQKMVNVRWKIEVPGLGLSSPVVWDRRLFITTAISSSDKTGMKPGIFGDGLPVPDSSVHEWKIICLDKMTGKVIWEKTACRGVPAIRRHPKSTHANTSVATDGNYVVAFFGSEGLYCYDMNGNLQWKKNFGVLRSVAFDYPAAEWEFASSPIIYNGVLVIQADVLENSFLAAFDVKTGKEKWKTVRDDYPTWATPNIYKSGNKTYVAVNGFKHMGGYDFETGKEIWRMSGGGDVPIPTPVIWKDMIFMNSAHGKFSPILGISSKASGDISLKNAETSNEFVKWIIPRGGSYIHTLLLYHNRLYNMNWNGTLICIDPITGKEIYRGKLGSAKSFIASPVASDGKIYIVDEEGTIYIIKDGNEFKVLAEVQVNDICLTAPSITDGFIFFRTQKYLIGVGNN